MDWVCSHQKIVTSLIIALLVVILAAGIHWPKILMWLGVAAVSAVFLGAFWMMVESLVEGVCEAWREYQDEKNY